MTSHVVARQPVAGERWELIRRFEGDPGAWLPPPGRAAGRHRWRIQVHAGPASRLVLATVGTPWALPDVNGRTLTWSPLTGSSGDEHTSRLLPEFIGRVSLRGGELDPLVLTLEGHYRPPGGAVGHAVDEALGHRVAEATAARLLADIAERLQAGEAAAPASGTG